MTKVKYSLTIGVIIMMAIAAGLWIALDLISGARAQGVVQTACDKTASSLHFDLLISTEPPEFADAPGASETKISVAGPDYHLVASTSDAQLIRELVYVDGVAHERYERFYGDAKWRIMDPELVVAPGTYISLPFASAPKLGGDHPLCPDFTRVVKAREEETIHGVIATRYTATEDIDLLKGASEEIRKTDHFIAVTTWDFWIDESGQIVQTRMVSVLPREQGPADQPKTETAKVVVRILDVGEANVITAPVTP